MYVLPVGILPLRVCIRRGARYILISCLPTTYNLLDKPLSWNYSVHVSSQMHHYDHHIKTDLLAHEYSMFHHPSIHTHAKLPTNQHCISNDIHDSLYEPNFLSDV